MVSIAVLIVRFVDDHQPGFVECVLFDAAGRRHEFIEKVPVVSTANLWSDSEYPQSGSLDCTIDREWVDELGRSLVQASTELPSGIESVTGETMFTVLERQIERT
jgi:hypothetical protein